MSTDEIARELFSSIHRQQKMLPKIKGLSASAGVSAVIPSKYRILYLNLHFSKQSTLECEYRNLSPLSKVL